MDNYKINQPDQETLHTADPQEHMKGPVSSIVNKVADMVNPEKENVEALKIKTFTEVKGTKEEVIYNDKLQKLMEEHSEYLMGDLKPRILENPDEYVEVIQKYNEIHLKWKIKP